MNDISTAQRAAASSVPLRYSLNDSEFRQFQSWIFEWAGITLGDNKKVLVNGRLSKRLRELGLQGFAQYIALLRGEQNPAEKQHVIDMLTTNETYFFREGKHFDFVERVVRALAYQKKGDIRFWCAACSTGEEPYSLAMTLHNALGASGWSILATDINDTVLSRARMGIYPIEAQAKIPAGFLNKYCLKGVRSQKGVLKIDSEIARKIQFQKLNLNQSLNHLQMFDFVFLRNVLIYFSAETKRQILQNMARVVRPGGYLVIGHSESLHRVSDEFQSLQPSIYQKR